MLIEEQYRKITIFLCQHIENQTTGLLERKPVATAFLISVDLNFSGFAVMYAITALHCIYQSKPNGTLYLRMNTKDGKYTDIPAPQDRWTQHETSDVALIEVAFDQNQNLDIRSLPLTWLATDEIIAKETFGIGDDVFFVSLFTRHYGEERALPIIRFGNISMMPDEPIKIKLDPYADPISINAYLVEARSWGGHSGAPAFIHFPPDRHPHVLTLPTLPLTRPPYYLLGLVHGHFDIDAYVRFTGDLTGFGSGTVSLNAGVGVVIPAQHIVDLVMREDLVEEREKYNEEIKRTISRPP